MIDYKPHQIDPTENEVSKKLTIAQRNWKKTIGENILRFVGFALALISVSFGVMYSLDKPLEPDVHFPTREQNFSIRYASKPLVQKLLLLTTAKKTAQIIQAEVLNEAISSYYGISITARELKDYTKETLQEYQAIIVYCNTKKVPKKAVAALFRDTKKQNIPISWIGRRFDVIAKTVGLNMSWRKSGKPAKKRSYIVYNGETIEAEGLPVTYGKLIKKPKTTKVLATIRRANGRSYPVIIQNKEFIFIGIEPFLSAGSTNSLPVVVAALSSMFGRHKDDPRVILRLEDVNGFDYGGTDTSFRKTVDFLRDEGVFVHLSIIPTIMDINGEFVADLDAAESIVRYVEQNQNNVAIVQHGAQHYRRDIRNTGKASGVAYEFFIDDDNSLGKNVSKIFFQQRVQEGYRILKRSGLNVQMFEVPHYEISPMQQEIAENLFPIMHYPPQFYRGVPLKLALPWLSWRDTTVYAPYSVGYVDLQNPKSVSFILEELRQLSQILPDPVVIVHYHPFVSEVEGRENDLPELVGGIKQLGYRFVNTFDELTVSYSEK